MSTSKISANDLVHVFRIIGQPGIYCNPVAVYQCWWETAGKLVADGVTDKRIDRAMAVACYSENMRRLFRHYVQCHR